MNTSIKIIGMGGIGTALIEPLCRFLNYDKDNEYVVSIIDGDGFEIKNRTRQSFDKIGNKAQVTVERLKPVFENILLKAICEFVTPKTISHLILDGDIVLMGVDNHKTRLLVSNHCLDLENVVLISGGNELTDGNIQVFIKERGNNEKQPIANNMHPEILYPQDKRPDELSCGDVVVSSPQIIFTNLTIAVFMLNAFYGYLTNGWLPYDEICIDILSGKASTRQRT